jgi:DNA-binding beta-propeller fold protein YncE
MMTSRPAVASRPHAARVLPLACALLVLLSHGACGTAATARRAAESPAGRSTGPGLLVIASMGESKVALVDGATHATLAVLDTGKGPHEVRVAPDGQSAYVAAGRTITAVDLGRGQVRANFDLGSFSAHDIRVSRDGSRLWAACAGAQAVLELDARTGEILNKYTTGQQGSWFVEVTPDERKLYTPNLEGQSVSVIDRATGAVKTLPFGYPVYGIDITPDGKHVWVTGRDVAIIDTATDEVVATVDAPEDDTGRLRLTSDGRTAVVALAKALAVFDVETRRLRGVAELAASPKVLTLSGDGRRAFLTNPDDQSVSVVDVVAARQVGTFATGPRPDGIGWVNGP